MILKRKKRTTKAIKLNNLFVFVMRSKEDGSEAIPATLSEHGVPMPMLVPYASMAASLKEVAQHIANHRQADLELRKFTSYEVLKTYKPKATDDDTTKVRNGNRPRTRRSNRDNK